MQMYVDKWISRGEWVTCRCFCTFHTSPPQGQPLVTLLDLSPFVEGGCFQLRNKLILAKDNPYTTMRSILTFLCSLGVFAGVSMSCATAQVKVRVHQMNASCLTATEWKCLSLGSTKWRKLLQNQWEKKKNDASFTEELHTYPDCLLHNQLQ